MRVIPRGQYIGKLLGDPPKDVAEPLKLRSSGLGSGIDKDRPDYTAFTASGRSGAFIRPARASAAARRKSAHAISLLGGNDVRSSPACSLPRNGRRFRDSAAVGVFASRALSTPKFAETRLVPQPAAPPVRRNRHIRHLEDRSANAIIFDYIL